jgi:hypothetical protein
MTERDIPESWSPARATEPDDMTLQTPKRQFAETHGSGVPVTGEALSSMKRRKKNSSEKVVDSHGSSGKSGKLPRWTKSWILWALLLALVPGSIGFMAMSMLFKLPTAPNCPSIFWPLASASVRLHCAQLAASKDTVNDLLQAIALVKQLPQSHPLRVEIDKNIEDWSSEILKLADGSFQTGKLDEAIATARKIPEDLSAYKLVEDKITHWQSIWSKAEGIYKEAEDHTREGRWHQAFMAAAKLLRVDNKFWETTKYEQLNGLITGARVDGDKLAKAEGLAKNGTVNNLLQAIKLAQSIEQNSYIYQKAQKAIPEFGRKMLDLAQLKLERRNADEAIAIAQQIPSVTGLDGDTQDFITLAEAQRSAWIGSTIGLEGAISQAQQISTTRPVYDQAQKLIARWQLEIQDVAMIEKARTLASQGTVSDLTAAINEAQLVPASNPRGREARSEIGRWTGQIQTIQDRPYLDRADQIALVEDMNSLQAAIAEASRVRRGRALYPEARKKIGTWTAKIERIQDQPYLDQARALARDGNLNDAIRTAQQIGSGRALAREAQGDIDNWEEQINAKENWKQAREVAQGGTADDLSEAIRLARRVPDSSTFRGDANVATDQWSEQLLEIARSQSESDVERAIETARLIPRGSAAYSTAREQIRTWREFLNPPEPQPQQTEEASPSESTNNEPQ